MIKRKIPVKLFNSAEKLQIIDKGDWIDLRANEDLILDKPDGKTHMIPLGIAMQLPKGYEAVVNCRSSTPKKFGVLLANSQGVIDNSYSGDNDQWYFAAWPIGPVTIHKGDRIAQFRIQLSQKAKMTDKLLWLFSDFEFVYVDKLGNPDRNGFGSTGVK